jgi:hypothetical protein
MRRLRESIILLSAGAALAMPAAAAPDPVLLTLDAETFANLNVPATDSAEDHHAALKAAFPGFEVGEHSWQYGVNEFSLTPGGDPLVHRDYVVQRDGEILLRTPNIHASSSFWVAHRGVVDRVGVRAGDTYAMFLAGHGSADCTRQHFSTTGARLPGHRLLICSSEAVNAQYYFDLPAALHDAPTMPEAAALAEVKLLAFDIHWREPHPPRE